ncbi:MAG: ATP-grasp domain-containing protein [Deltaproteobacteria bacterium]|nr:ATP-grasp domain-containing protein [Deltaproteobacteria bacterium]
MSREEGVPDPLLCFNHILSWYIMSRIFVTDGHWRKTLAVVRSLGRKGLEVTVGESSRVTTSFFSKYCHRRVVYPSVHRRPDDFLAFLRQELTRRTYDILIPMEEETLLLLARHKREFAPLVRLPITSYHDVIKVRDKGWLLQHALKEAIPMPQTYFVEDIKDLTAVKEVIPPPWVIKPRVSSGAYGIVYVNNEEDLPTAYQEVHRRFPFPLIQERIPQEGEAFGLAALLDKGGVVKALFAHRRLREYPVRGGPSTLRESVRHPRIEELGLRLLRSLGWYGVAMVEFKVDPRDNTPKLMELNPRFWGSLALAIQAGVDFPCLLYKMAMGEEFDPVLEYELGKRCRWLLPGDILHFLTNPRRFHLKPSFFQFRGMAYDILSQEDPLPTMGRFLTLFSLLWDGDLRRLLQRR